jgi:hypothetical protein
MSPAYTAGVTHPLASRAPWLDDEPRYDIEIDTFPFYNGRERAVGLRVRRDGIHGKGLILVFGEDRRSDALFFDRWVQGRVGLNPPTVADFSDEVYRARRLFPFARLDLAADAILEDLRAFLEEEWPRKAPEAPTPSWVRGKGPKAQEGASQAPGKASPRGRAMRVTRRT